MKNIVYSSNWLEKLCKHIALPLLALCFVLQAGAQTKQISGTVSDADGPLQGVTVKVSGTNVGAMTNASGQYTISAAANSVLEFSFLGYATQQQTVGNRTTIDVTMSTAETGLDDVVVVGFGKQKKESVVGAIQTISPKQLRVPSSSLSNAFAGKLSGVISVQRTGEPGADGANFWIRGISTFAGNTSPLIFIDGVEASTYDMNSLAPEVIENFSVLKDATATALYGARGANGVMLITTRQGRNQERATINIRVETQMTQPTQMVELADGVRYMEGFNEARLTRGGEALFSQEKIDGTRRGLNEYVFPNVNWQDFLFNDWAYNQTANLNVTGGGERVTYFMSASVNNDNGMLKSDPLNTFKNNISQQRYSIQGNIAADLTKTTKATVRLNTNILNYAGSRLTTSDLYSEIFQSPGIFFAPYYPTEPGVDHIMFGNKSGGPHPQFNANLYHNVYSEMVRGYNERNENTNTVSFELEQDLKMLTKGLKLKGLISFKNWSSTTVERYFTPYFYEVAGYKQLPDGSYDYTLSDALTQGTTALSTDRSNAGDRFMNLQASIDYNRTFNDVHDVGAMLVYLQRDYHNNVPADYYATLPTRNQGIAGRLTYAYDNRYMIEANFGYNGSENFEDGKRFGFFPSFAAGYNISNEKYWDAMKPYVSQLKIRGSWGIVGNSSTDGRFPYLSFVNLSGRSYMFGNNWQTSKSGATITRYGAEGASWEEGLKMNVGVDIELFKCAMLTVDVYQEDRSGIFMRYNTIPVESGISSDLRPYANLGKVHNQGVDATLDINKAFLNNELIVNVRGSFTYAKNKLVDRDEPAGTPKYMSEIGKPLNRNTGLVAIGLFKDQAEIDASPRQTFSDVQPGDIKYADLNNDNQIDGNDMQQMGDPTVPQIVWGAGVSASYKGFDLSVFFQGVAKTSIMMGDIHPFNGQYSQLYEFIADDYWSESNPNPYAKYPRLSSGEAPNTNNNHQRSSFWLRDGSFFRLKNLEVGYTYKFARLYLSAQNLFTIADFDNWDPELGGIDGGNGYTSNQARGLKYPNLRVFSAGLQFTF